VAHDSALNISGLTTELFTVNGPVAVVDHVDLAVEPGQTIGLVGESGCGKSMLLRSILSIVPRQIGRVVAGTVTVLGDNLTGQPARRLREIRGTRIALIPQDPMVALSPLLRVGTQMNYVLRAHQPDMDRVAIRRRCVDLLASVGVPEPDRQLRRYPHEFSGGMLQRVTIAMALSNDPAVILADEPTTALDVTVQAQILDVLRDRQQETGMALVLVSHDLGVIGQMASRVNVMYAGRVIERSEVKNLFIRPTHPYTAALLASTPSGQTRGKKLQAIAGQPPALTERSVGCDFEPRCTLSAGRKLCRTTKPTLLLGADGSGSACHYSQELISRIERDVAVPTLNVPVGD
jgi:oligopeptide/dipeptide ABC transporter ATP-binding protein